MKTITFGIAGLALMLAASTARATVLFSSPGTQTVNNADVSLPIGGLSRDDTSTDSLYFKYTLILPQSNMTTENYFAGLDLWLSGVQKFGVGNGWVPFAYSAFYGLSNTDLSSSTPEPSQTYQLVRSTDVTTFVFKIQYNASGNDTATVWLNPNLSLAEGVQAASLTTTFTSFGDASFNDLRLREGGTGNGWSFSNIIVANSATDIFVAIPEPSTWALVGMALVPLFLRRRR